VIGTGTMRPVTVTLTNVKLRTALDAHLRQRALQLEVRSIAARDAAAERGQRALASLISLELFDVSPVEVFGAVATEIGAPITIEAGLPSEPVSFNFRNAPTAEMLNLLCNAMRCAWDFDPVRGLRVMAKR